MPHLAKCNARATREVPSSKLKERPPQRKIGVTSNLPVGRISVVTLVRTDTTLDRSQKAAQEPLEVVDAPCYGAAIHALGVRAR